MGLIKTPRPLSLPGHDCCWDPSGPDEILQAPQVQKREHYKNIFKTEIIDLVLMGWAKLKYLGNFEKSHPCCYI